MTAEPPMTDAQLVRVARHMSDVIDAHEQGTFAIDAVSAILSEVAPRALTPSGLVDEAWLVEAQRELLGPFIADAEAELRTSSDASADEPDGRENR